MENQERSVSQPSEKPSIATWPIEKEMRSLVPSGQHLNQDAVYQRISAVLPIENVRDKVHGDFSEDVSEQMITELRSKLGEEYLRLLVEPSLSTRFDDFLAFAQTTLVQHPGLTPWELRNRFRDSLGKKTVYRVSTVSPADLENILTNGFISNFYRNRPAQTLLQNEDGYKSMEYKLTDLQGRVNVHAGAFAHTRDSMLISVSDYPEMAQYAGTVQLRDSLKALEAEGRKLYLFPIVLDEFYLVRYGKYLKKHRKGDGSWTDGKIEIPYNDDGVEAFVEFRIPPKAIIKDEIQVVNPSNIPQFKFVPKAS